MVNYDITIQNQAGDAIKFWGSKYDNAGNVNASGYEDLDGIGEPERRTTVTDKSGADGGLIVAADQQYSSRVVSFTGWVMAHTNDEINQWRQLIRRAFVIREQVLLTIETPTGIKYGTNAVISTCKPQIIYADGNRLVLDIDIDLTAADPYWQDYSMADAPQIEINKMIPGGLQWSDTGLVWSKPGAIWSAGSGVPTADNGGTENVYPLITITGQTSNPVIGNLTTGESIRLPLALADRDIFEIDMDNETLKLNGANMSNTIVDNAWWGLIPGVNRLQYTSSSDADTAVVTLSWRDKYLEAI